MCIRDSQPTHPNELTTGLALITQVCSSANSAVHSVDAVAEAQRRELEIINGFLHFKRVPVDLRRRTSPGFIRVECALHWGVWQRPIAAQGYR